MLIQVLDAMAAAGVEGDDETYEWLANAAVRGVDFVTVRCYLFLARRIIGPDERYVPFWYAFVAPYPLLSVRLNEIKRDRVTE